MLLGGAGAWAQVAYPPPALAAAQSIEAAAMAVGAMRPEFSGYLLLGVPEISLPGTVDAVVTSELPGTTQLVLLRQFPEPVKPLPATAKDKHKTGVAKPGAPVRPEQNRGVPAVAATTSPPPTVLVAAAQISPGQKATLSAQFNFQRNERFTLLAFAQGRWFATTREMKLAKAAQKNEP